jgi:5'-deoxynucleotidase YfbR-like HD superfamily hydrolase
MSTKARQSEALVVVGSHMRTAIRIAELAMKFGEVTRTTKHPDGRPESDATHTVMLQLLALELAPPELDRGRVVLEALVHDLVEFDALDTCTARGLSPEEAAAKDAREAAALEKIRKLGLDETWAAVKNYERQESPEARWVRYVDKICPKLTHLLNRGQALRAIGMTASEMRARHAAQAAELEARYPEQTEARALFLAACEACDLVLSDQLIEE